MHQEMEQANLSEFSKKVYLTLLKIPKGKVTTYKAVAHAVGTKAYRMVGQVIGKNPFIPEVPCHRVVASNGKLQGYAHGLAKKQELLQLEGVQIVDGKVSPSHVLTQI